MSDLSGMTTEQLLALYGPAAPAASLTPPAAPLKPEQLVQAGQQRVEGDKPLSWSDVPGQAIQNLPSSAYKFGEDIVQPFLHPVETLTNIGNVGSGVAQKLGLKSGEEDIASADAVGEFFKSRYGSVEGFKQALAKDPVGVAGDLSTVFTGGGAALARAPGVVGRVGQVARTAGNVIDPLAAPVAAAGLGLRTAAGLTTGVGGDTLNAARIAARDSREGSIAVRDHMRGNAPLEQLVTDAQSALDQMRVTKQQAYRQDMRALARDKNVLDWSDVDRAVGSMSDVGTFKGISTSRSADPIRNRIIHEIDYWKSQHPADYHTPEGFDALKKSINDIGNDIPFENKAARLVVKQAADAVKNTIIKQAPGYADTMRAYERASTAERELTRTFSLGDRPNIDTALRKLTSAMRNNVNTNFGRRRQLLQDLTDAGAPQLMNQITGASLNSWEPRGLARAGAGLVGLGQIGAAISTGGLAPLFTIPAQLAASSPRLTGEIARGIGAGQRYAGHLQPRAVAEASRQAGRLDDEPPPKRVIINTSQFR